MHTMEDLTLDLSGDSVNAVFYELHLSQAGSQVVAIYLPISCIV